MSFLSIAGLVGITIIVTWSSIMARVRRLSPSFLGCALCVGFWVGLLGGAAHRVGWLEIVMSAGAVSVLSMLTKLVIGYLDRPSTS